MRRMTQAEWRFAEALGHGIGDKRLDILRRIGETGSISSAARAAGVSYKAAWQAIDTLSNLAGTPLVDTAIGGSGGGGARLTRAGSWLIEVAARLDAARAAVLTDLDGHGPKDLGHPLPGRQPSRSAPAAARPPDPSTATVAALGLGLRTSLRNQLPCRIASLRRQGRLVTVTMALSDGSALASRITSESAELLGLHKGLSVLALCKATAVTIASSGPLARQKDGAPVNGRVGIGARAAKTPQGRAVTDGGRSMNELVGTVARSARSRAEPVEVALDLGSGLRLVGFAEAGQALKAGMTAVARFEASGVVIAVTMG